MKTPKKVLNLREAVKAGYRIEPNTSIKAFFGNEEYMEMLREGRDFGAEMGNNSYESCACCGEWTDMCDDDVVTSGQAGVTVCGWCLINDKFRSAYKKAGQAQAWDFLNKEEEQEQSNNNEEKGA